MQHASIAQSQSNISFILSFGLGKTHGDGKRGDGKRVGNSLRCPAPRLDLQEQREKPTEDSGRPVASRCNE